MGVVSPTTLPAAFRATVERNPDGVALRTLDDSETYTWRGYADEVDRVARGFAALGVGHGDTVAMLLSNRPSFHISDTAALHLGATGVSIYPTLPPEDIAWTVKDSGAKVIVTELAKLDDVRASQITVPIVVVDGAQAGVISFADLDGDHDVERAWRDVQPDDVAVIVYTSGTTGTPKGAELTHAAVLGNSNGLHHAIGTLEGARVVSYLPMAHAAERQLSHYRAMVFGLEVTTCPDTRLMPDYLLAVRPHYFFAPPRMLAKFRAAAAGLDGPILKHFGLDQAVVALTGSAPVPAELTQFWLDAGLPLVEAWGVTECGAFGAFGRPGSYRVGTCGTALPGVELMLTDDGEILLRSPWIMRGYRNQPDATAEAIDRDGWLHTGDIGEFDDGHLRIIDRKKEIIINAAGKNMSPAHIEARVKESGQVIGEAVVIGDNRPFNVALVVPDPVAASQLGGEINEAIVDAMRRANARLARVEQIKRIEIVNDTWLPGGDELTPTMKLKRRAINMKYAATIDQIYAGGGIGI